MKNAQIGNRRKRKEIYVIYFLLFVKEVILWVVKGGLGRLACWRI
jgi:hypothetical protein